MGVCEMCGGMGQACCGTNCNTGFVCAPNMNGGGFTCQTCGASMEPCCANRMCNMGLTCTQGMGAGGTCQ